MGTLIEIKNYQGVRYYKLANGDIAYYVRYQRWQTKFGGWNEKLAFNEKIKLENNYNEQKPATFKETINRCLEIKKIHLTKKSFSTYASYIRFLDPLNNKF